MGKVTILRYDPEKDRTPYWQEFEFQYEKGMTVLDVVMDIQRRHDGTLAFGYSCRNSHCGLCSARINGRPGLMCREPALPEMTLEPLEHVPVIRDLMLDLDSYTSHETALRSFLERTGGPSGEPERVDMEAYALFRVASRCVRCLDCLSECPVYASTPHEYAGPAMLVRLGRHLFDPRDEASRELMARIEGILNCTACGACSSVCPHDLDPREMILKMKGRVAGAGLLPSQVASLADKLPCSGTAFEVARGRSTVLEDLPELCSAEQREKVADGDTTGTTDAKGATETRRRRVGLFVGCLINTHPRLQHVAKSAIKVLTRMGWDVVVPRAQVCCGLPLHEMGLDDKMNSLVKKNLAAFQEANLTDVVTICSGCGNTAKNVWPAQSGGDLPFAVYDFSEFVYLHLRPQDREILSGYAGRVGRTGCAGGTGNPGGDDARSCGQGPHTVRTRVTYHDPCSLNRGQGITEQPRALLQLLSGIDLVESPESDRCCGGGGEVPLTNPALADALASYKAKAIAETGAQAVVTCCPTCMRQLLASLRKVDRQVEVLHLADVLADQMDRQVKTQGQEQQKERQQERQNELHQERQKK